MSAFFCDESTFHKAVGAFADDQGYSACESLDALGNRLRKMNNYALSQRYGNRHPDMFGDENHRYRGKGDFTLIERYKAVRCLIYQCSEGDTDAVYSEYDMLEAKSQSLAWEIIDGLPEYDAAAWG